jgi:serine/threonine protein kinase/Tfp pilus assembly protein PilF
MQEQSIFIEALEKEGPVERAAFLDKVCAGDPGLRQRIERLLQQHQQADSFLDAPPAGLPPTVDEQLSERPGTVIGPYSLLEQIGEGGMGLVFVAEQQQPVRRKVALKVIKPGMDTRQVIARFEAERQALALMDHPHIARVLDGGETASGRPYFVMELVKGVPITDCCDLHRMAIRQRLELFVQVCQAVQHAHQKGIIHRDLKPSNVLVVSNDGAPTVKVIDFGVAKAIGQQLTDKTVYTHLTQLIGTPLYMSPEQAGESGLDIDTRSDIYALGVLLYELLTGTTPFDKERLQEASYDEIRRIICEEEPPRPSKRISTVGQLATAISTGRQSDPTRLSQLFRSELDWIVMKALEKDRNRRYETASAFAADVQRYLQDEPVQACPPSAWYRFRKFTRRHRGALAVAGLLLIFLVLLGGAGLWWVQQRAGAAGEARAALAEAIGLLEEERWPEALSAARRAEAVLAGIGADPDLRRQAHEQIRDLDMAERLQEARLQRTAVKDGYFDSEACDAEYAAAFAEYGLDVDRLDVQAAAEQIHSRPIHQQLVGALDDWADVQKALKRPGWRQRLAVARAADPDAWRNHLRDALEQEDRKALEKAATANAADDWPIATIHLLGELAMRTSSGERVSAVLVRAQQRHPGDFWLNETLGLLLMHARPPRLDEAICYYTAAVALRPQSPGAHLNLGSALTDKGWNDRAIAEYQKAIGLKKDYAEAHNNLGNVLYAKGLRDEGIAEYREAIRIKKDFADAHHNLGSALRDKGLLDESIAEYQEGIRIKKDNAYAHYGLGRVLDDKGLLDEGIAEYREAIRIKKDYVAAHCNLGTALHAKGLLDEGIAEYREAIRIKKDCAEAHNNLGTALRDKGLLDEAIAECREAIRLDKDDPAAHYNLGNALGDKGLLDEAIAECREAIRLNKDCAEAHDCLGSAFSMNGRLDDAIAEHREAIRINKEYACAHHNLGNALRDKGLLDEAIAEYREAMRLKKDFAEAHNGLSTTFFIKRQLDDAIAEYKEAIRLKKNFAGAHYNLAKALRAKDLLDEAIAAYRDALRIKPEYAEAHCNLGFALKQQGEFQQGLQELRRGHQLGSKDPRWNYPSAAWVRQCEHMVQLDGRLPDLLAGATKPESPGESIELARLCILKHLNRAAVRFYEEAFAGQPKLADDLRAGHRYDAACAAALAAAGQGKDADKLDSTERRRLRRQALDWLRADLAQRIKQTENGSPEARTLVQRTLADWQQDSDLASLRGEAALTKLPAEEQPAWRRLWKEVEALRQEVARPPDKAAAPRP